MKQHQKLFAIGVVALVIVAGVSFTRSRDAITGQTLTLQAPAFVRASEEGPASSDIGQRLSDEAGISAYLETSSPIDLDLVDDEFRTIETQTSDYIIGSVPVPDHSEHFDAHVYVHSDGYILAYYMEDQATSKMVDIKAETISSTKLETVVSIIAGAVGEAVSNLKYYDFRHPNAESILMVAEDNHSGRDFTIELPSGYAYSERSWAAYDASGGWDHDFTIDGSQAPKDWSTSTNAYGAIPASQLLIGEPHTIEVDYYGDYCVLVITYRVP
jgi:hypothetical protein